MSKAKARLADVQCSRLQFQPGDKLLVKTRGTTKEDRRKVKKLVEKWAGDHVEVLVIDVLTVEIEKLGYEEHQGFIIPGQVEG